MVFCKSAAVRGEGLPKISRKHLAFRAVVQNHLVALAGEILYLPYGGGGNRFAFHIRQVFHRAAGRIHRRADLPAHKLPVAVYRVGSFRQVARLIVGERQVFRQTRYLLVAGRKRYLIRNGFICDIQRLAFAHHGIAFRQRAAVFCLFIPLHRVTLGGVLFPQVVAQRVLRAVVRQGNRFKGIIVCDKALAVR